MSDRKCEIEGCAHEATRVDEADNYYCEDCFDRYIDECGDSVLCNDCNGRGVDIQWLECELCGGIGYLAI